jgi:hypothetical protein
MKCGMRIAECKTQFAIMILNLEFEIRLTSFRIPHSAIRISSPLSVIRILPMLPEEMFVEQTIRDCGGRGI